MDALKGRQAVVLERVDGSGGRIKLAGEVWSARALDAGHTYDAGQEVDVVDIEGPRPSSCEPRNTTGANNTPLAPMVCQTRPARSSPQDLPQSPCLP
ncbi:hypothetical protein GCM10023238_02760 [Streptomyces heliomycini]